eukprot:7190399-Ditylum_brightwellii.AAC.1
MAVLNKVQTEIGYEKEEKKIVNQSVEIMRRFKTLTKETPKESSVMSSGMIDELMSLKERYLLWPTNMDATSGIIEEVFTQAL